MNLQEIQLTEADFDMLITNGALKTTNKILGNE